MTDTVSAQILYGLAWLSFGLGHSVLALESVKARLRPWFGSGYRLAYNLVSLLHLGAVFVLGHWLLDDEPAFDLPPVAETGLLVSLIGGIALMIGAARGYDLARLLGTRQIRCDRAGLQVPDDEPLRRDGLHRFVRHPIYAGAILFLWGGAADPLGLATAVWGTVYLLVGIVLEERKLVHLYGESYRHYRMRVPALIPWRGRAI